MQVENKYYNMDRFVTSSKHVANLFIHFIKDTEIKIRDKVTTLEQKYNQNRHNNFKKVLAVIAIIIVTIITVLTLMLCSETGFCGYTVRIVVTGSMKPTIEINSLNIIKICDIEDINVGDIVCYKYGKDIIHRAVDKKYSVKANAEVLVTRGDANQANDDVEITNDMIVGKVVKTFNGVRFILNGTGIASEESSGVWVLIHLISNVIIIYFIIKAIKWIVAFIIEVKGIVKHKADTSIKELTDSINILKGVLDNTENTLNKDVENTDKTRIQFIVNCINKARARVKIKSLCKIMGDFGKSIDNMDTTDKVVTEIESKNEASVDIIQAIKEIKHKKENGGDKH